MVVCIFIVSVWLTFSSCLSVYLKTPVTTLNRNICPLSAITSWHEMFSAGSRHISFISEPSKICPAAAFGQWPDICFKSSDWCDMCPVSCLLSNPSHWNSRMHCCQYFWMRACFFTLPLYGCCEYWKCVLSTVLYCYSVPIRNPKF